MDQDPSKVKVQIYNSLPSPIYLYLETKKIGILINSQLVVRGRHTEVRLIWLIVVNQRR